MSRSEIFVLLYAGLDELEELLVNLELRTLDWTLEGATDLGAEAGPGITRQVVKNKHKINS